VACEIVSLQFRCLTTTSCDRGCIDSQVVDPPMVALGLQTTGVEESFKAKPPNPTALVACLKRAAFVHFYWSARLGEVL
jgi:hypothetical protein